MDNLCLVLDMGGEQSRLIARKVRGERVYCEVLPFDASPERIMKRAPRGIILAGGTGDPFSECAKRLPEHVYALGLPILGLGYGAGVLLRHEGGALLGSVYGIGTSEVVFDKTPLFDGLERSDRLLDHLSDVSMPDTCRVIAKTEEGAPVAFENAEKKRWGIDFLPEQNDPDGLAILRNFVVSICGCEDSFTMERFIEEEIDYIRRKVGTGRVLMTISGGVDSAVCASLLSRAIGDRLICLHVDTGLLRAGEDALVRDAFSKMPGMTLHQMDARKRFLSRLRGVSSANAKREAVMDELARAFEDYADGLDGVGFLAQGTTYDDVLAGASEEYVPRALSKDHPMILEPVCRLFKDEVRALGDALGLPFELTRQQAFPGVGLALRCLGAVTEERLSMLRAADLIFRAEIEGAGLEKRIRQYFAVLTDLQTGDALGKIGHTVALRAVNWTGSTFSAAAYRLPYDLLERVVERITSEVPGVSRVVYDVTGKPPAGIEWD